MLKRELTKGILAGLSIALGGSAFLACESKEVGAMLFCVALLTICCFGFSLYTGKIGYMANSHGRDDFSALFLGVAGNVIGCVGFGLLIRLGQPQIVEKAEQIWAAKLDETVEQALIRAFFCGVLMYIAVRLYRENNTYLGIFVCVPTFILSGFEHSVANTLYFSVASAFSLESVGYLALFYAGNTLGGLFIPILELFAKEESR